MNILLEKSSQRFSVRLVFIDYLILKLETVGMTAAGPRYKRIMLIELLGLQLCSSPESTLKF